MRRSRRRGNFEKGGGSASSEGGQGMKQVRGRRGERVSQGAAGGGGEGLHWHLRSKLRGRYSKLSSTSGINQGPLPLKHSRRAEDGRGGRQGGNSLG